MCYVLRLSEGRLLFRFDVLLWFAVVTNKGHYQRKKTSRRAKWPDFLVTADLKNADVAAIFLRLAGTKSVSATTISITITTVITESEII